MKDFELDHGLLSPSGHMSKRARRAALKRIGAYVKPERQKPPKVIPQPEPDHRGETGCIKQLFRNDPAVSAFVDASPADQLLFLIAQNRKEAK